jgi:hypothetical protein
MALLDVTIVNIAFPDMRRSFPHDSLGDLSWVFNGYNIVFAAALCRQAGWPTVSVASGSSSVVCWCS